MSQVLYRSGINMPVQIQCTSVVIRNDALDRCLEGGAASFSEIAPNAMSYSDDRLSQASFMSTIDADEFVKRLELRGLSREGDNPDFTIVDVATKSMDPVCDWLILFEYEGRTIVTIKGSDSRTVIAPQIDDSQSIRQFSAEEIQRDFEFVEREGGIDVYREKATGKLVYHARQTESPQEIFDAVSRVVWDHRRHPGEPPCPRGARSELTKAVEKLQFLATRLPDSPDIAFHLGLAWFALGNARNSQQWYSRAAELAPGKTSILKDWAGAAATEGNLESALEIAQKAVACVPDDPELLSNLAVIQLLNGQIPEAEKTITRAVELQGDDATSLYIQKFVADVITCKRPSPQSLAEIMQPPGLLSRLKWYLSGWFKGK